MTSTKSLSLEHRLKGIFYLVDPTRTYTYKLNSQTQSIDQTSLSKRTFEGLFAFIEPLIEHSQHVSRLKGAVTALPNSIKTSQTRSRQGLATIIQDIANENLMISFADFEQAASKTLREVEWVIWTPLWFPCKLSDKVYGQLLALIIVAHSFSDQEALNKKCNTLLAHVRMAKTVPNDQKQAFIEKIYRHIHDDLLPFIKKQESWGEWAQKQIGWA